MRQTQAETNSLALQPIAGFEHPADHGEAKYEESQRHRPTDFDTDIGGFVEAPAEAADEINDGIEQSDGAPGWWQHVDGIEGAAKKSWRCNDQHGDEL